MATIDSGKLAPIVATLETQSGAVEAMLKDLAEANGIVSLDFDPVSADAQGRVDEKEDSGVF